MARPTYRLKGMFISLSHERDEESFEAKVRWFHSLSVEERMEVFCAFTDLILTINPSLKHAKPLPPASDRVQVISLPSITGSHEGVQPGTGAGT